LVKLAVAAVVVMVEEVAKIVRVFKVAEEATRAVEELSKTHLATPSSAETSSRARATAPSAGSKLALGTPVATQCGTLVESHTFSEL
jgi:hypothetical protein